MKYVSGMLCRIARRNGRIAAGIVNMAAIDPAPADWPSTVTLLGSPPKRAMLSRTQSSAAS